jgi:hypothetical protein
MTDKRSKSDREFESLQLRSAICPSMESRWDPPEYQHWIALHKAGAEFRDTAGKALASMDAVSGDKDLTAEGKQRRRQDIAKRGLAQLGESPALQKARDAVERQMQRWSSEIAAVVKPAKDEVEASLHAEVRRFVLDLKDPRARMSFLEQRGSDPAVASALLEAPAFLSGLSDSEIALIRAKVEQKYLSPEMSKPRAKSTRRWPNSNAVTARHKPCSRLKDEMALERITNAKSKSAMATVAAKSAKSKAPIWAHG